MAESSRKRQKFAEQSTSRQNSSIPDKYAEQSTASASPPKHNSYFNDPEYSDLTIKFGDQEIYAHRRIISKKSERFHSLLRNDSSVGASTKTCSSW